MYFNRCDEAIAILLSYESVRRLFVRGKQQELSRVQLFHQKMQTSRILSLVFALFPRGLELNSIISCNKRCQIVL